MPVHTQNARPRAVHDHRIAEPAAWPWLPTERGGPTVAHPYCADCGLIKAVGSDRALDLGGLLNLFAQLRRLLEARGHVVIEAQRRLIIKRLQAMGADDAFGQTRTRQLELVAEAVARVVGLPPAVVHSYLHHC